MLQINEFIFSKKLMKDIFLLISVVILLLVIWFCYPKTLENFDDDHPPSLFTAHNKRQLFDVTRIYPTAGQSVYWVGNYPNRALEGEVIGCGSRRELCYGGSQTVIGNILPPLEISDENVAPTKGRIGPYPPFQQVGYLYKIMAPYVDNSYHPLYLNRPNPSEQNFKYDYFTIINEIKKKVKIPCLFRELGTNDQVEIEGEPYFYRVTVNDSNFPSYPNVTKMV